MDFVEALRSRRVVLAEGAVIERIRRDPAVHLDPEIANTGLVFDENGRRALGEIYKQYLDIGCRYELPMLVLTPTWRASPTRLHRAGFNDIRDVSAECFGFLSEIRDSYGKYGSHIVVGGVMGCAGDAYDPSAALTAEAAAELHREQVCALADAGVDFLMAATLPALSEAMGIAVASAATGCPYLLSFVVRPTGSLLDGTRLHEAVARIDASVDPAPLGYMVNCAHPSVFEDAIGRECGVSRSVADRVVGLQANASPKSPEELDGSSRVESDEPDRFGEHMLRVHRRFGTKVLGGCCGTDHRHIEAIANRVNE